MPMNEKEFNGNLMNQLFLIETIESAAKRDGLTPETAPDTFEQIKAEKH